MRRIAYIISIVTLLLCGGCEREYSASSRLVATADLKAMCRGLEAGITEDVYIEGFVVANDRYGECNYSIIVNDDTGGVEVVIECRDIDSVVGLYNYVRLKCSGLHIGRRGAKFVIGKRATAEYVVDQIPEKEMLNRIKIVPSRGDTPKAWEMTIGEINSESVLRYARLRSLRLIAKEQDLFWCDKDSITQRYTTTIRHFSDGRDTLRVMVAKDSQYADSRIPIEPCSLTGIIDWYDNDICLRITSYQFVDE